MTSKGLEITIIIRMTTGARVSFFYTELENSYFGHFYLKKMEILLNFHLSYSKSTNPAKQRHD